MRIKLEVHITRERDERSKFDSLVDAAMHLYSSVFQRPEPAPIFDPASVPRERHRQA